MPRLWRRLTLVSALLAFTALVFGCGVGFEIVFSHGQANQQKNRDEREAVEPILSSDPAFRGVVIEWYSAGGVMLHGDVPTAADRDRLENLVGRALGAKRASEVVCSVLVRNPTWPGNGPP